MLCYIADFPGSSVVEHSSSEQNVGKFESHHLKQLSEKSVVLSVLDRPCVYTPDSLVYILVEHEAIKIRNLTLGVRKFFVCQHKCHCY